MKQSMKQSDKHRANKYDDNEQQWELKREIEITNMLIDTNRYEANYKSLLN